jgi:LysM repeat protein
MRRRSPARWLAPLALLACAFAIYTVVNNELLSKDSKAKTTKTTTSDGSATGTTSTTKRKSTKKAKTYTVKSGDSFSVIASKEGIEADALQAANPKVDASALHPGQKLKLPR